LTDGRLSTIREKMPRNGTDGEVEERNDRQDKTEPVCSLVFPVLSAGYDSGYAVDFTHQEKDDTEPDENGTSKKMGVCPGHQPVFGSETASKRAICCKQFALKRLIA
jgi:hypothetical protein